MRSVLVLCTALLAACGEQPVGHLADALAADPVRLKALREQCTAHPRQVMQATGEDACCAAAEAFRQRFFSGQAGPDEYQTLADLPPIPPSFDEPADGSAAIALPGQEDSP